VTDHRFADTRRLEQVKVKARKPTQQSASEGRDPRRPPTPELVFTVHVTKPDDVGAIEIVFRTEQDACAYAQDRSRDFRILSVSVTRFTVGELGTRRPVTWFVNGEEQQQRWDRQLYPTDGTRHPA
jgi:hypothetical protein